MYGLVCKGSMIVTSSFYCRNLLMVNILNIAHLEWPWTSTRPYRFREIFECNGSFHKDDIVKIGIWLLKIAVSRTITKILTESKTLSQWVSINTSMILKGKITRKYNFSNNANIRRQQCLRIQFAKQLYMSEIKTNI